MAQPVGPNFAAKAMLTTGRVLNQPFEIPTEMTKSALIQGGVAHAALGSINSAALDAVDKLKPRGPAKLLTSLLGRVDSSLVSSADQAKQATETFWKPFSNSSREVGHAVSNPFALGYAKRAGFEVPSEPDAARALLASLTNPDPESTKFPGFTWPAPPAPPAEEPPKGDVPAPADPDAEPGQTPVPADPGTGDGGETPAPTDPTKGDGGETPAPADPAKGDGGETPAPTDPAPGGDATPEPVVVADGSQGDVVVTDQGPAQGVATADAEQAVNADTAQPAPVADAAAGAVATTTTPDAGAPVDPPVVETAS